jgi:PilZ domain-containing protein
MESSNRIHVPSGRRYKRLALNVPVTLVVGTGSQRVLNDSQMLDASEWGARLKSDVVVSPGQLVEVIPREGTGLSVRGRVVRIDRFRFGESNELGLEFLNPVPPAIWTSPKPKVA